MGLSRLIKILEQTSIQLAILVAATVAVYAHTLDAPFYLDDFHTISERALLYKEGDITGIWRYSPARFVAFFSFYLNYQIGALNLAAYHAINILIHIGAGLIAFALTKALLRTPALASPDHPAQSVRWLPFAVAAIFLLHPLQTQGVTYIVQRMTSMAALFYLAALTCYLHGRLSAKPTRWWVGVASCALLAFLTKQNAFTLPAAIVLIELIFFHSLAANPKRFILLLAGSTLGLAAALQFLYVAMGHRELLTPAALLAMTTENLAISRAEYFYSQQEVLWRYIGLFFFPIGQRLEWVISLKPTLWLYPTVAFFVGHVLLIYAAILLRKRLPLVAFGIIFYYLAHLIESALFPIRDLMFEHRAYLPNYGLILATTSLVMAGVERVRSRVPLDPIIAIILLGLITTLGTLTWQRNTLWRDEVAFLKDNARLSPTHYRPLSQLGLAHMKRKQYQEGVAALRRSIMVYNQTMGNTGDLLLPPEIFTNLLLAETFVGESDKVLDLIERLLADNQPNRKEMAHLRMIQGAAHLNKSNFKQAEAFLKASLSLEPEDVATKILLAQTFRRMGRNEDAVSLEAGVNQLIPYMTIQR